MFISYFPQTHAAQTEPCKAASVSTFPVYYLHYLVPMMLLLLHNYTDDSSTVDGGEADAIAVQHSAQLVAGFLMF